jgi:DNA-binding transcriptional LysR family regulator
VDVTDLRNFVAVADQLHFTRAAKSLGISRQALSSSVTAIEAELGIELFDRAADSTQLTDDGRALLARALPELAAEALRDEQTRQEAASPPVLRLAFVPGVTIGKWTEAWQKRHPDIALSYYADADPDPITIMKAGGVDLSFVRLPIEKEGLSVIRLYSETAVVVAARGHPIAAFETVTLADLTGETVVDDPLVVSDAVELVAAGGGLLIVPQSLARMNARKDVVARPVTDVPATDIAIAWVTDALTPAMEEFVGIVRGRRAGSSRSGHAADGKADRATDATTDGTPGGKGSGSGKKPGAAPAKAAKRGPHPITRNRGAAQQRTRRRGSR